jgi:hypothetical protein
MEIKIKQTIMVLGFGLDVIIRLNSYEEGFRYYSDPLYRQEKIKEFIAKKTEILGFRAEDN